MFNVVLRWIVPVLVAVLCVAGSWLWLLGIPGDASAPYARPWLIGLISLIVYPATVAVILVGLLCTRLLRPDLNVRPFRIALWLALLIFGFVQALVWSWMLFSA
jgi:hypothetical protein